MRLARAQETEGEAGEERRKLDGPRRKLMVLWIHLMIESMRQAAHYRGNSKCELRSFVKTSLQSK